jgi:acetyl esterase/lipase
VGDPVKLFTIVASAAALVVGGLSAQTMTVQDILSLSAPEADHRISYGEDALQFGDLRLPDGDGPHPVVVVIHGGCWRSQYNLEHISSFCAALTRAGLATWSLEYRRVGDPGGGWPGTFEDVALGTDTLRTLAESYPLELDRVAAVGHSAGGHLVLWLAARSRLPAGSPLYSANPLPLRGVVSLAGIPDLERAHREEICGDMVSRLLGGAPTDVPDRYRQGSPIEQLPLGIPLRLVHGALDTVVPPGESRRFESRATEKGDDVQLIVRDEAAHYEPIAPQTEAWKKVRDILLSLTR